MKYIIILKRDFVWEEWIRKVEIKCIWKKQIVVVDVVGWVEYSDDSLPYATNNLNSQEYKYSSTSNVL